MAGEDANWTTKSENSDYVGLLARGRTQNRRLVCGDLCNEWVGYGGERFLGLERKRRLVVILVEEERESLGFGKEEETTVVKEERVNALDLERKKRLVVEDREALGKDEESDFGETNTERCGGFCLKRS